MELTRTFIEGNSQTVKLPEVCMFEADTWANMRKGLAMFTGDCFEDFEEGKPNNADN